MITEQPAIADDPRETEDQPSRFWRMINRIVCRVRGHDLNFGRKIRRSELFSECQRCGWRSGGLGGASYREIQDAAKQRARK